MGFGIVRQLPHRKQQAKPSTHATARHAPSKRQASKPSTQARQAKKRQAKLRPSVTAKKKTKKPLRAYRFRFCLISSVIRINLARAIKAMSLFIIKPVYRVKSLIEKVTLSLKS
jgi:hypothetical protein